MQSLGADNIRSLSTTLELVLNARDLGTLDAIDRTVDELNTHRSLLRFHTAIIRKQIDDVRDYPEPIDIDGAILKRLEGLRDKIGQIHSVLLSRFEGIRNAPTVDPEDGLVEALNETICVTADMHNAMNDLCWAVGEHDADFEQRTGKKYTSVDEMFSDLGL
jgi:hypothetical protein